LKHENPGNEYEKMLSQSLIIDAIYNDWPFGFMRFEELRKATGLAKKSLRRNLDELCQEKKREGPHSIELAENYQIVDVNKLSWEELVTLPKRRVLKSPMLVVKNGVYALHPLTKWALDNNLFPFIGPNKNARRAAKLLREAREKRQE